MIHDSAIVDDPQSIGVDTNVWAFAHVLRGAVVGDRCNLGDHVFVEGGVRVGNNVTLKNNVMLWEGLTIEDDVFVGPGVVFTNDRVPRSPRMECVSQRYADKQNWLETTFVERGCSIGGGATICPGVRLGRFSMVAAGAVVTGDVPPYSLVMGVPARHVGDVCSCGKRLAGTFLEEDCNTCGELASDRSATERQESANV